MLCPMPNIVQGIVYNEKKHEPNREVHSANFVQSPRYMQRRCGCTDKNTVKQDCEEFVGPDVTRSFQEKGQRETLDGIFFGNLISSRAVNTSRM